MAACGKTASQEIIAKIVLLELTDRLSIACADMYDHRNILQVGKTMVYWQGALLQWVGWQCGHQYPSPARRAVCGHGSLAHVGCRRSKTTWLGAPRIPAAPAAPIYAGPGGDLLFVPDYKKQNQAGDQAQIQNQMPTEAPALAGVTETATADIQSA